LAILVCKICDLEVGIGSNRLKLVELEPVNGICCGEGKEKREDDGRKDHGCREEGLESYDRLTHDWFGLVRSTVRLVGSIPLHRWPPTLVQVDVHLLRLPQTLPLFQISNVFSLHRQSTSSVQMPGQLSQSSL
jgi:hypothetical protein